MSKWGNGYIPEYQNLLSDIETISIPMTSSYDGFLIVSDEYNGSWVSINGIGFTYAGETNGGWAKDTSCFPIVKGDIISGSGRVATYRARWYKQRDYTGR